MTSPSYSILTNTSSADSITASEEISLDNWAELSRLRLELLPVETPLLARLWDPPARGACAIAYHEARARRAIRDFDRIMGGQDLIAEEDSLSIWFDYVENHDQHEV